ncbi:MAG: hypothetical protein RL662_2511 [Bacteroidota bacterium]|jgi:predicted DsbA family dithiol-disulfide isomerase
MNKMKIEIWSDIACPYCYIGKRRLEEALSQFPHANDIELVWRSYELNQNLPKGSLGKSIYQYMAEMHKTTEQDERNSMQGLVKLAQSVGLNFDFDKLIVTNTSDALRLVKLAAKHALANEAEEVLFKAYFVDGKDISSRDALIQVGTSIGLPETEITNMLDSDIYISDIKKDIQHSESKLKLEYIPFYLFNNKDNIQGSLTTEEYARVLHKSYDYWKQNGVADELSNDRIGGQACSIDGVCSL